MNGSEDWRPYVRALIYPVQFERDPLHGLDRVLESVEAGGVLDASPERCLGAVRTALASDEGLAELIPQGHSEDAIRRFLSELEQRLAARAS